MSDHRNEGITHFDAQRWEQSALAFERALALQPSDADLWYRLGNARQELKLDAQAAECFERAAALQPARAQAWNNLGVCRDNLGQAAPAIEAYCRALQEEPGLLQALHNLGYAYLRAGEFEFAVPLLERVTILTPADPEAWERLGYALASLDRTALADAALRTATEKRGALARPLLDTAEAAIARGDPEEIRRSLAAALEVLPGNPALVHMLAAAQGAHSAAPPTGYVARLFDGFAQKYDRKMIELLEYRVPELLAQVVRPSLQRYRPARVADLGCGTGLVGAALADTGAQIVGIDLSEGMLARARELTVYARLVRGDLIEELRRFEARSLHAVLAADVFVYLGDLEAAFAATARALAPGGVFAFSTERLEGERYRLGINGRYAHSARYLRDLGTRYGLLERSLEPIRPRREGERYVEGWLACFVSPESAASG